MIDPSFMFSMTGDSVPPYTTHTVVLRSFDSSDLRTPAVLQSAVASYAAAAPNCTKTDFCKNDGVKECRDTKPCRV